MSADVSLVVEIDRTSLDLDPLLLHGDRDHVWGITRYKPAERTWRRNYAPESRWLHGSTLVGATYDQTSIVLTVVPFGVATELALQVARLELEQALGQLTYAVTTTLAGAPAEVWLADRGDLVLANSDGRTYADVADSHPRFVVTIPCHPIPTGATP